MSSPKGSPKRSPKGSPPVVKKGGRLAGAMAKTARVYFYVSTSIALVISFLVAGVLAYLLNTMNSTTVAISAKVLTVSSCTSDKLCKGSIQVLEPEKLKDVQFPDIETEVTFNSETNTYNNVDLMKHKVGDEITIYVSKDNGTDIKNSIVRNVLIAFLALSLISALVCFILLVIGINNPDMATVLGGIGIASYIF